MHAYWVAIVQWNIQSFLVKMTSYPLKQLKAIPEILCHQCTCLCIAFFLIIDQIKKIFGHEFLVSATSYSVKMKQFYVFILELSKSHIFLPNN